MVSQASVDEQVAYPYHSAVPPTTGSKVIDSFAEHPYSLSRLQSFLAANAGGDQQSSTSEAAQYNSDSYSNPTNIPPAGISQLQPPLKQSIEITQPALLTPNTQTFLQDLFNMSTPGKENTLNGANSHSALDLPNQLALYPFANTLPYIMPTDSENASIGMMYSRIPMYPSPSLLPTGLNLLSPSPPMSFGPDPSTFTQMFPSMTSEAMAYHMSLPVNLSKPVAQSALPQIEQQEPPPQSAPDPGFARPPDTQKDFNLGWSPGDVPVVEKRVKDPIDVPPFVREKLLRSFFDNICRCPCSYVNRDLFDQRMAMRPEARPHPSWIFSMYLIGAIWLQDPSIRTMESHFCTVAKEQLDLGLSKGDRSLDLIRAGVNIAIYLIQRNREQESFVVSMQAIILDTFGILVGGRPPSTEGHLTSPLHYIPADANNSTERFVTLLDLFEGTTVDLQAEIPSGAPTRIAVALLGYVFNLTFLPREEIGDNHRRAKIALDSLVAAFPRKWHDIRNYKDATSSGSVPERHTLLALWCTIHVINAYICEIDPNLTLERPVDHAIKIAQYMPLVQEGIATLPMHMTIYLEFCAKALAQEGVRLHMMGCHRDAFSLERMSELVLSAMVKISRVYGFQ
ncbi:hypothetical protein QFC19_002463 [Naganishia cerealis]|uniref:Uncharacterized protein n=1 Tax=Naganishia cerealis TaxID=610337 RepID=A0ACC2W9Y6_9TREE|nr:hypothetical protein QFC19_002463 [Naganishia cerealis]